MADDLRLFQKQLRELLNSNVESLLTHVEDPKLLESSVTRLMGFMSAGDEISSRLLQAEKSILRCQQQLQSQAGDGAVRQQLNEWEAHRDELLVHLKGLVVRLRNI
jgi:hypothetical protein